ncbi:MAG: FdtA/QdtA family cupin domain-containing protein [Gammaproteobacteria bacterium]|nr:FdtA/QdtA family cupin domain-containing protein [Gammaproteobacteria bacterium]
MDRILSQGPTRMTNFRVIDFDVQGDSRGNLISLESGINIPFDIKRVYYIFSTKAGVSRGLHAHKSLEQVLVAVSGSCKMTLDDGESKAEISLNANEFGLYVGNKVWREMYDFSPDCVLMVLASDMYRESDYIRDYKDFIRYLKDQTV